jgi:hypothetical protein
MGKEQWWNDAVQGEVEDIGRKMRFSVTSSVSRFELGLTA